MIISGETGCWPDPGVGVAYPYPYPHKQPQFGPLYTASSGGVGECIAQDDECMGGEWPELPFPYPNSGGYMGRLGYLREAMVEVMDEVRDRHVIGGESVGDADDQVVLTHE